MPAKKALPSFLLPSHGLRARSDIGVALVVASWASLFAGISSNQHLVGGVIALLGAAMWTLLLRKRTSLGNGFLASAVKVGFPMGFVGVVLFHWLGSVNVRLVYVPVLPVAVIVAIVSSVMTLGILAGTLLVLGVPWSATHGTRAGLHREDRAHLQLGALQAAATVGATFISALNPTPTGNGWGQTAWFGWLVIFVALVNAGLTQLSAIRRISNRKTWIAQAESGTLPDVTVEQRENGKAFLRVQQAAHLYRVADRREELLEVDMDGEAFASPGAAPPRERTRGAPKD